MGINASSKNRTIIILAIIVAIIACISVCILSIMLDTTYMYGIVATILLATAIILPIQQKRFSFFSIALVISSILLILGGVVEYAYHIAVAPLPDKNQFEFLEIMRPLQIGRGLATVAMGILLMATSFFGFQKDKERGKPINSTWQFLWWVMAILGILLSITGIDSIIEGLHKL